MLPAPHTHAGVALAAQGIIELPYIMVQSLFFVLIVYSMIRFEWTAPKFL